MIMIRKSNSTLLVTLMCLMVGMFYCTSCIKNDIPYPTIPLQFLTFEVEGQVGKASINTATRTITVQLDETIFLKQVKVKECTVTEGIEAPLKAGDMIDLSSSKSYTLSLYQDYQWTIQAVQNIERAFLVGKQVGKSVINTATRQVVAFISSSASQKEVEIKELKLGPAGITTIEPPLQEIVDFTHPQVVTVSYHDVSEEWTILVSKSDKNIATGSADAWGNVAGLHGSVESGQTNGFEYKELGLSTWNKLPQKFITEKDGEITGRLSGLKASTSYLFRAYSGENYGDEVQFTTSAPVALPNGGFDEWHKDGKVWNPWAEAGTPIWDTGNDGATTIGESITVPTDDIWSGAPVGSQAVQLGSKFVGLAGIGKFAAGNLFMGEYVATDGTNGILSLGKPFDARPTRLRGYYKYTTAPITCLPPKSNPEDYERFLPYLGKPDTCSVYIALGDWSEPVEIRTNPKNRKLFDKNDPNIIAYAEFNSGETTTEYTLLDLELEYRATNRVPTYMIIVYSASKFGDFFTGGEGATMFIDEFSLEYDY